MTANDGSPQIPVFDIVVEQEDLDAVAAVLREGWLSMGPRTEQFERDFAEHLGVEHVVAVSSCTAALHLACIVAGVGPGDEVIVPSMTFAATANAVRYCNATPVFGDLVSTDDLGLDPVHAESLITERTKAIIPVHYAGYAVDIVAFRDICDRHGIALIEDAAHSPDATVGDQKLGSFGDTSCFSFFPNKVLAVGEGGCLATNDSAVAERVSRLRSQGMTATTIDKHRGKAMHYDVVELGYNYRFDDPRAALLNSRFARLHAEIVRRRELVHRYREMLAGVDGLEVPFTDEEVDRSSCYLMAVMTPGSEQRREMRRILREDFEVQTTIYPAVHRLSAFVDAFGEASLPNAEEVASRMVVVPLFPHITEAQQDRVVEGLVAAIGAVGARAV